MNPEALSKAYRAIGQGYYEAADVLLEAATATQPVLAAPRAVPDAFEASPFTGEPVYEALPIPADTPGLGRCPFHGTPWSIKAAGVSKAGKPYNAFYHCDGKEPDGSFCQRKPTKGWADAHRIAA